MDKHLGEPIRKAILFACGEKCACTAFPDSMFFYQARLSGLPVAGNIKIALAFQREIINRIIPEVQPDLVLQTAA